MLKDQNGTYKIYYHINEMYIVGIENIQGELNLIGASYNIKRLFNIITEKQINWDDVYKVMDILTALSSNLICNRGIFTNEQNSI